MFMLTYSRNHLSFGHSTFLTGIFDISVCICRSLLPVDFFQIMVVRHLCKPVIRPDTAVTGIYSSMTAGSSNVFSFCQCITDIQGIPVFQCPLTQSFSRIIELIIECIHPAGRSGKIIFSKAVATTWFRKTDSIPLQTFQKAYTVFIIRYLCPVKGITSADPS